LTAVQPSSSAPAIQSHRKVRRYRVVAIGLLVIGIIFALALWYFTRLTVHKSEKVRFDHYAEMIKELLGERIDEHISALHGMRAFINASERVTRAEWARYVSDLDVDRHFAGALGFSFIRYVRRDELGPFLTATRADGAPDFQINTSGSYPDLGIIEFIQPLEQNRAAVGYDLGQETVRRQALVAAVDQDQVMLSSRVILIQDEQKQPGFLLLLPVYNPGAAIATRDQRWSALRGWVGASIRVNNLLSGIDSYFDSPLDIEIFDGSADTPNSQLYDADGKLRSGRTRALTDQNQQGLHSQVALEVAGRIWTLNIIALPGFTQPIEHHTPEILLAGSLLLSLLAALLVASYGKPLEQAQALAEKMTADLRASEQRFHRMFRDHKSAMLLVAPADGRIIDANDAASRFYGYPMKQLKKMSVDNFNLLSPEEMAAIRQKIVAGETRIFEFRHKLASGDIRDVEVHSSPIEFERQIALFSIIHDITSEKTAERNLIEMDRMKNEFISTAAHELRTPLSAIMGFTELLLTPEAFGSFSEAQKKEFLGQVYERGEALSRIIDEMLDISRIESGHPVNLDLHPVDFRDVLIKVLEFYRLHDKTHLFHLVLPDDAATRPVTIDRQRINQVLENLLSNAVKYSPHGSDICIEAILHPQGWEVRIEDKGIGMTPEQVDRIFDKFYRANAANTAVGGLGLGMSIAKQIVDAHGGKITVKSHPGQGTQVCFILPTAPD